MLGWAVLSCYDCENEFVKMRIVSHFPGLHFAVFAKLQPWLKSFGGSSNGLKTD